MTVFGQMLLCTFKTYKLWTFIT